MTLLFHAQYLDTSGHAIRTHAIFAEDLERAYELAIERAHLLVDPIPAPWVTIQEDHRMFLEGQAWASPFKPVHVVPIPPLELDVNGKIAPPHVMP